MSPLSLRPSTRNFSNSRYCSYKGCNSDGLKTRNGNFSFFSFPTKDTERCSIWITYCGREEFRFLTPQEIQGKKVCELHFERKMFSNEHRTHLVKSALPINHLSVYHESIEIHDEEDENEEVLFENCDDSADRNSNYAIGDIDVLCEVLNGEERICNTNSKKKSQLPKRTEQKNGVSDGDRNVEDEERDNVPATTELQLFNGESVSSKKNVIVSDKTQEEKNNNETTKSVEKENPNTKFHNLPPQTTQSDFYYQQCATADETTSFSEPPEAELPLFVQQGSIMSMGGEQANSESSEPPRKRHKWEMEKIGLSNQIRGTMKHLRDITALLTKDEGEFDLFGKSVALQLKKMSLCTALTVQAQIQQLLSQSRITEIQQKQSKQSENTVNTEKTEHGEDEIKLESTTPHLFVSCDSDSSEAEETEVT